MSTFYDRTSNVTPSSILTGLTYSPAYGSRATFTSRANTYDTTDGYFNSIPMSLNSLTARFDLRFDLSERDAQNLVYFIENKSGQSAFLFADGSQLYKPLSGFSDQYAINHMNNNHYEVGAQLEISEAPTLLNWSGMTFINTGLSHWQTGRSYQKYDIVYSGISTNKLNNYYYCTGDHTSSTPATNGPTGTTSMWTQNFFFESDIGIQNDVSIKVDKVDFKNSFVQRGVSRKHLSTTNFNYKFTNVPTIEAKSILHFLEVHAGFRRFRHDSNSVYNKPKVFFSPTWSHTWKYADSHDIEVTLIEDPLGIVPTGT